MQHQSLQFEQIHHHHSGRLRPGEGHQDINLLNEAFIQRLINKQNQSEYTAYMTSEKEKRGKIPRFSKL
jgi:hypothetical protein